MREDHDEIWLLCERHRDSNWPFMAAPCPNCGRRTFAVWRQCGHCAYHSATCAACLAPVGEAAPAAALAEHETRLGHPCDVL